MRTFTSKNAMSFVKHEAKPVRRVARDSGRGTCFVAVPAGRASRQKAESNKSGASQKRPAAPWAM